MKLDIIIHKQYFKLIIHIFLASKNSSLFKHIKDPMLQFYSNKDMIVHKICFFTLLVFFFIKRDLKKKRTLSLTRISSNDLKNKNIHET